MAGPGHPRTLSRVGLPAIAQAVYRRPPGQPESLRQLRGRPRRPLLPPLERAQMGDPPPTCAQPAVDPYSGPSPDHDRATRAPYPLDAPPDAAHLPAPDSRRAAAAAAAAAEGAAAGAPAAAAAAAGGLGPWPGGLREPSRAAPSRAGGAAGTQVRIRSSGLEEGSRTVPGDPGKEGVRSRRAAPGPRRRPEPAPRTGEAGKSVPRESGRTGRGRSWALERSEPEDSGRRAGARGHKWL